MNAQLFTTLKQQNRLCSLLGLAYDVYGLAAERAIHHAPQIGYRLIDTASLLSKWKEVGSAVRNSGIKREEILHHQNLA